MTIKAIKEKYDGVYGNGEKTMFKVFDYGGEIGKAVIVATKHFAYGNTVWQAVRVSDGAELIKEGRCRPCDSMMDAIDVAEEMMEA